MKLFELKQNTVSVARFLEKLMANVATIFSQLRVRPKKSTTDLLELGAILEILQG